MAISFQKYIDITSGVGGGAGVRVRDLIARIFTTDSALAVGKLAEFETLADVGTLFGTDSEEYKRASFYFGWVSKNIRSPKKISFARWDDVNETVTEVLTASTEANNNFGSFCFTTAAGLTVAQVEEAATWNAAQNNMFQFSVSVAEADTAAWSAALIGYAGTELTLASTEAGEYHEMIPMAILAATDYTQRNSVQNFMFQQFNLTPTVTDTITSNTLDDLRVNYYGRTQTAGQLLDFYQRGVMMGGATAPVDMNTYANEQWLKDYAGAKLMELFLAMPYISANDAGRGQIMAVLQDAIDLALFNGTISVAKPLNTTQKLYITNITGDVLAWHQVQDSGYWVDCALESYVTEDDRTEWKATYTVIYSKNDIVRSVEGTHILI